MMGQRSHGIVIPPHIFNHRGSNRSTPLDEPFQTVTTGNHKYLVTPPFIVEQRGTKYGMNAPKSIGDPLGTISAGGRHHAVVMPPSIITYTGRMQQSPIGEPIPTVTTRDRNALLVPTGKPALDDCFYRMLATTEIGAAMAFPAAYIVLGTQAQIVKQFGNAVTPPMMEILVERAMATL